MEGSMNEGLEGWMWPQVVQVAGTTIHFPIPVLHFFHICPKTRTKKRRIEIITSKEHKSKKATKVLLEGSTSNNNRYRPEYFIVILSVVISSSSSNASPLSNASTLSQSGYSLMCWIRSHIFVAEAAKRAELKRKSGGKVHSLSKRRAEKCFNAGKCWHNFSKEDEKMIGKQAQTRLGHHIYQARHLAAVWTC